ncbi:MAG: mobile mystery protein B [Pirellulales bacterium]|nr:mobile mystery protein B [Pirellulales bacterium]
MTTSGWRPIPGETPIDPSGLKDRSIKTREDLARAEERSIRGAYVKYLAARPSKRVAPYDRAWMQKLHREMFDDVWEWAGEFRQVDLNLGCRWWDIPQQVHSLCEDLKYWKMGFPLLDQVVFLHHRAVAIHPFLNGNGRWARLLANIWQYIGNGKRTLWPEATLGNTSPIRTEYIHAVKMADKGDFEPLKTLHARYAQ